MTDQLTAPPSTSSSPFGRTHDGQWSRRAFLGTTSALSLGAVAGCSLPWSATDDEVLGAGGKGGGSSHPQTGDPDAYAPVAPLALTADAELTQDYFVFQTHAIDPAKDKVIAYSRADGEVEAILLQDREIKQIYRDPTQPGGWNVHTFADASNVSDVVAGVSQAVPKAAGTLKVFYTRTGDDQLYVAVHDDGPTPSFTTTKVAWNAEAGSLQISVGYDDSLLVAAMIESSSLTATDAKLLIYSDTQHAQQPAPVYGSLTGFSYNTSAITGLLPGRWSATVIEDFTNPNRLVSLALPHGTYGPTKIINTTFTQPSVSLWSWELKTSPKDASMVSYLIVATNPPAATSTTTAYSVEYSSALGSENFATLIVRTTDSAGGPVQRLWSVSPASNDGAPPSWKWTELQLPTALSPSTRVEVSVGISPLPSSEVAHDGASAARRFMDTFVLTDDTFSVIRQAPQGDANLDWNAPVYCPAIPLQNGVAAMTSQANVSTGNELLVVGDDGLLQYLVKDPVSDLWSDNPVHLPAEDVEETSTYQVTLGLTDYWAVPVARRALQITASGAATAVVNGAAMVLSDRAVTVNTDDDGQVVVALLADGLSAPTLTIVGDGVPTATVNPSAAVNSFMQGGSTLNALPPLSAGTLAAAKAPDGTLVAPGANDPGAADDVDTMTKAADQAAALAGTVALGRRPASVTVRRDGRLTSRSKAQVTGVVSQLDKWGHDALHGIKKGAVKVAKVVYDEGFKITTDLVHWTDKVVTIVVKTLVDAAHVIESVLVKLGAMIKKAIEWVRAEVIDTLRDAADLADQYVTWLDQCCGYASTMAKTDGQKVSDWLTRKQQDVTTDLTAIAHGYAASTTLASMATTPPKGASATARPQRGDRSGAGSLAGGVGLHGDWFFSKIKNEIFGELQLPVIADLARLVAGALVAVERALGDVGKAFKQYLEFWTTLVTRPDKVMTAGVQHLLLATVDLIDSVFDLARGLSTTLLALLAEIASAIPDMLTQVAKKSPLAIGLLSLIKRDHASVGHHVAMSFAFKAVVAYKLAHGGKGRPFAGSGVRGRSGAGDDLGDDLRQCAGVAVAAWSAMDARAQLRSAFKIPTGPVTTAIDIAAPFLVGALTVPSTSGGEPYFTPPVTSDPADFDTFVSWLASIAPGVWTLMGLLCEKTGEHDPDLPAQKRMAMFATFASGVLSLAFGCAANKATQDPEAKEYALAVLLNMPYIIVPATDDELVETTDGVTAGIAAAVTLATGVSGGVVYGMA